MFSLVIALFSRAVWIYTSTSLLIYLQAFRQCYVYGLMAGLFAWISLTALSQIYFSLLDLQQLFVSIYNIRKITWKAFSFTLTNFRHFLSFIDHWSNELSKWCVYRRTVHNVTLSLQLERNTRKMWFNNNQYY